jgi:hypothetical protein
LPYMLFAIGMLTMLFSGVLLFISTPSIFYVKPYVTFNSIPLISLSVLLFLFGNWLSWIFPAVKVTRNGLRCKHMFFYGSVKWSEMDTVLEFKNGVTALSINRKGLPLLNGLFFEWLTGKALRQKVPMILFTPEFFGGDKTIPQEIIANTPPTSRVSAYLSGKINGTGFINPSRFSIQESNNGLLITIPGKKNFLEILFIPFTLYLSYFEGYAFYLFGLVNFGVIVSLFQTSWDSRTLTFFIFFDVLSFLFIGFLLFWIFYAFTSTIRHMTGKEIVNLNGQSLTITKQIYRWKRLSTYPVDYIKILRVDVIKPKLIIILYQALQSTLGRNGVIVFELQGKSVRFGLDLSEDEGNYILAKIKSRMNM